MLTGDDHDRLSARKAICGPARRRNEQARTIHRDRRLRPGASAGRRQRADRRRRSGVHAARARGDLLPRLPSRRFRYLRTVDEQLHGENRERRLSVCRRAGVSVARVPPQLDLYPNRPRHRAARGPERTPRRGARISGHCQRLDARGAGRRARREAVGHQLGARRLRAGGTHREDRAEPAGQCARARRAGRCDHLRHAGRWRYRCGDRPPRPVMFRPPSACRLAVSRSRRRGGRMVPQVGNLPDHAHPRHPPDTGRATSLAAGRRIQGVRAVEGARSRKTGRRRSFRKGNAGRSSTNICTPDGQSDGWRTSAIRAGREPSCCWRRSCDVITPRACRRGCCHPRSYSIPRRTKRIASDRIGDFGCLLSSERRAVPCVSVAASLRRGRTAARRDS